VVRADDPLTRLERMAINSYSEALAAMTALLVALAVLLAWALWRFSVVARESRKHAAGGRSEGAFVASAMQDALARVRSQERALQERAEASERLSDSIVSGLSSGLLLVDGLKRLRIINPAGTRVLGLQSVPANASFEDVLAHYPPLAEVIAEGLADGTPITRRLVTLVVPRHGPGPGTTVERHLGVTVSPLSAPDGNPQGVICLFTDLTKVIALEEQVRLKDGLALLGELTAGLAHELRNGLATVHGYVRLLDPAVLPPPQDGYVTALREETAALSQLVTNFLNFARPVTMHPVPVDLSAVVARVRDEFAGEAASLGGSVSVTGRFGRVEGDEILLRQAISNLCRNAIEACAGHGAVPRVSITGEVDAGTSVQSLRVSDNGPGIDLLRIDKIFQPFFTTKATGTGLGLALAQKILVTHNGRVTAANRPEGGAAFDVRLPLAEGALGALVPLHLE
jgi:signal transduction histidine kinase